MEKSNAMIDGLLEKFRPVIGDDFSRYRNHVYRVFLNCLLIDGETSNEEKYAIAAVFHDIGIWTDRTIDYLAPSIEQARLYLNESGKKDWMDEISLMIHWHHKTSKYRGGNEQSVESFRKADLIDVSLALLTFGLDKKQLAENKHNFPNLGFHLFLVKATTKNFFKHPLNPLPMFTR